ERGIATEYLGNYSNYLLQKEEQATAQLSAFERQQKEVEKQQAFVERFRASATRSTQANSREKQHENIDRIDAPTGSARTLKFKFPPAPRSGREVVQIEDLTHTYGDQILFLGAELLVERGDRIVFLGPNGCGKSTLLRMVAGIENPDDGRAQIGQHGVIPSYFAQNQAEAMELTKTVIDTIQDEVPDWDHGDVRALLGQFLFSGDTVFKKVEALSGGEKARLALAKMLVRPANLLILDEPTNHLDIPAKEMLEDAIRNYDGTVLVVSHDRFFISRIANKVVELKDGELNLYRGDYQYYQEKIAEQEKQVALAALEAEKAAKAERKRAKQRDKQKAKKAAKSG
ncbi:MAG: ABC-F family ATP-binding cassette domain-containing protein, partial [Cyanophyceae cyanobacterium]